MNGNANVHEHGMGVALVQADPSMVVDAVTCTNICWWWHDGQPSFVVFMRIVTPRLLMAVLSLSGRRGVVWLLFSLE
jgi:hypothetical protein